MPAVKRHLFVDAKVRKAIAYSEEEYIEVYTCQLATANALVNI